MEEIKLKANQEINNISLEPADNGGCALRYTVYTPAALNNESDWKECIEVYKDEEMETVVFPRILELYKADYANSVGKKAAAEVPKPAM